MTERQQHVKRIQQLESALRQFAEMPTEDSEGSPIKDIHVEYDSGSGYSMRLAAGAAPRKVMRNARKLLGLKLTAPKARV